MMTSECMPVTLEFGGGAELLFNNLKEHELQLPNSRIWTVRELLIWMKDNLIAERPDLFFHGDSVRPGILVLVNETDWELMGELEYEIQRKDKIMFISTLHGG
ncbi:unnamed protein product [Nezara viridula]|uniref:Ubiquitin-related modifier 1 homolog n=1 Tax=Nezara viridula TaxID=85310 RepID=A0A9P0MHP3_NEZVI|nr:unnamed protein product [Nezara viridula]